MTPDLSGKWHVVSASQGEYSDRNEWPVAVFADAGEARAFVDRFSVEVQKLKPRPPYDDRDDWCDRVDRWRALAWRTVNKAMGAVISERGSYTDPDDTRLYVSAAPGPARESTQ